MPRSLLIGLFLLAASAFIPSSNTTLVPKLATLVTSQKRQLQETNLHPNFPSTAVAISSDFCKGINDADLNLMTSDTAPCGWVSAAYSEGGVVGLVHPPSYELRNHFAYMLRISIDNCWLLTINNSPSPKRRFLMHNFDSSDQPQFDSTDCGNDYNWKYVQSDPDGFYDDTDFPSQLDQSLSISQHGEYISIGDTGRGLYLYKRVLDPSVTDASEPARWTFARRGSKLESSGGNHYNQEAYIRTVQVGSRTHVRLIFGRPWAQGIASVAGQHYSDFNWFGAGHTWLAMVGTFEWIEGLGPAVGVGTVAWLAGDDWRRVGDWRALLNPYGSNIPWARYVAVNADASVLAVPSPQYPCPDGVSGNDCSALYE